MTSVDDSGLAADNEVGQPFYLIFVEGDVTYILCENVLGNSIEWFVEDYSYLYCVGGGL